MTYIDLSYAYGVMDASELDRLFAQTLESDYDDHEPWEAVSTLRSNGTNEIFDRAAAWCRSTEPLKQARGADILSQLRLPPPAVKDKLWPDRLFPDESFALIWTILDSAQSDLVVLSSIHALGHLGFIAAVPIILRHLCNPNEDIRFAVACALGHFHNDPQAIQALLRLMTDPDHDVRDWATFGLGVLGEADSLEIREALLQRLADPNEDVREEAAIGLGKRHEPRLLPVILEMLDQPILKERVAEAASALLGLEQDPPEWEAQDYKAALKRHFSLQD